MIVMSINGGLGNQLFQYALGRKLSMMHNTQLQLDTHWFLNNDRLFHLPMFLDEITEWQGDGELQFYDEGIPLKFDEKVFSLPDNSYLNGCWQSYKYFEDIANTIHNDISFNFSLSLGRTQLLPSMISPKAVAIHIRRGDYIRWPELGVLPEEYYEKAIKRFRNQMGSPQFFIFGDSDNWSDSLSLPASTLFIDPTPDCYIDLFLMSLFSHIVIANSTFSWWAAFLNPQLRKQVIYPKDWFRDIDSRDLLPLNWQGVTL